MIFRKDRKLTDGVVALLINDGISTLEKDDLNSGNQKVEMVWLNM